MQTQDGYQPANIRPFLRWAGSKRKLLKHLIPFIPHNWNKYYEPFLGGGAMFFYLGPKSAEISDASEPLIDTYQTVRKYPTEIIKELRPLRLDRESFDRIKRYAPRRAIKRATQFIFLNKACWNGLFRVNADGIFNVPFGRPKSTFILDETNFVRCSTQLRRRGISIRCQDFEVISDRVVADDFVFLDPPYVTSHNMNGFVDWNEALFSWGDQIRLAAMARKLVWKGANVVVTNAAHEDIADLYSGFGVKNFNRSSTLASDIARRTVTSEAIFFAGPAYLNREACQKRGDRRYTEPKSRPAHSTAH